MSALIIDEDTITEDQQAQAEVEYNEDHQRRTIQELAERQEQAKQELDERQNQGRVSLIEGLKKSGQQAAINAVKEQVKKKVWLYIVETLSALLFNPYTLIFLIAVAVIILGYYCFEDVAVCGQVVGFDQLWTALNLVI